MIENAQLIGLSRQIALARQMDVVANNVANLNTTGFKSENLLFEEYIMPVAEYSKAATRQDRNLSYTQDWATVHNFQPGTIAMTGNDMDVALQGDGFLVVQTPEGERWTRDGSLKIDSTGLLVNSDGYPVMSEGGEVRFSNTENSITFNKDGSISSSDGQKGTLRIVEFANAQELAREGYNLFSGGEPLAAQQTYVQQGALERSNVSGVSEIATMIRVQRAYESIASLLDQQSKLRTNAIRDLGKLNG